MFLKEHKTKASARMGLSPHQGKKKKPGGRLCREKLFLPKRRLKKKKKGGNMRHGNKNGERWGVEHCMGWRAAITAFTRKQRKNAP